MHSDPKKKASGVGITHVLRRTRAKEISKFPTNFGAPRAQKLRELGRRGCANRRTSLQLFFESACVRMQDNARVQRRDDANLAQKSGEKFAKFPEIRHAPRTEIARTRPACAAHTSQRRRECIESVLHSDSKRKASSVGITQILPPNSRERNFKVSENFGAPRAQKLRELGQRGCANHRTSLRFF